MRLNNAVLIALPNRHGGLGRFTGRQSVSRRYRFAEHHPFRDYWEGTRPVVDVESLYPPEVISGLV